MPWNPNKFSKYLNRAREQTGNTAYSMSIELGMGPNMGSTLSTSSKANPTLDTMEKWARKFGCQVGDFLDPVKGRSAGRSK